jgi:hypothetical protein
MQKPFEDDSSSSIKKYESFKASNKQDNLKFGKQDILNMNKKKTDYNTNNTNTNKFDTTSTNTYNLDNSNKNSKFHSLTPGPITNLNSNKIDNYIPGPSLKNDTLKSGNNFDIYSPGKKYETSATTGKQYDKYDISKAKASNNNKFETISTFNNFSASSDSKFDKYRSTTNNSNNIDKFDETTAYNFDYNNNNNNNNNNKYYKSSSMKLSDERDDQFDYKPGHKFDKYKTDTSKLDDKTSVRKLDDFTREKRIDEFNMRKRMMISEQEESSDQYNNEDIFESILTTFKFTRERFEELNEESTKFVKTYWVTMNPKVKEVYFHYNYLNRNLDSYWQFGANNCSVRNVLKFCNDLNIEYDDLVGEIERFPRGMDTKFEDEHKVFRGYAIYSRDRKLGLRVSSKFSLGGYFHYFNAVGERNAILNAYKVINTQGKFSEICWGGPF